MVWSSRAQEKLTKFNLSMPSAGIKSNVTALAQLLYRRSVNRLYPSNAGLPQEVITPILINIFLHDFDVATSRMAKRFVNGGKMIFNKNLEILPLMKEGTNICPPPWSP